MHNGGKNNNDSGPMRMERNTQENTGLTAVGYHGMIGLAICAGKVGVCVPLRGSRSLCWSSVGSERHNTETKNSRGVFVLFRSNTMLVDRASAERLASLGGGVE